MLDEREMALEMLEHMLTIQNKFGLAHVFIDPDYSGDHYYQLAMNMSNSHSETVITNFGNDNREDFNMTFDSAVAKQENSWTAELAIPYSELLVRPDNKGIWSHLPRIVDEFDRSNWNEWIKNEAVNAFEKLVDARPEHPMVKKYLDNWVI